MSRQGSNVWLVRTPSAIVCQARDATLRTMCPECTRKAGTVSMGNSLLEALPGIITVGKRQTWRSSYRPL